MDFPSELHKNNLKSNISIIASLIKKYENLTEQSYLYWPTLVCVCTESLAIMKVHVSLTLCLYEQCF